MCAHLNLICKCPLVSEQQLVYLLNIKKIEIMTSLLQDPTVKGKNYKFIPFKAFISSIYSVGTLQCLLGILLSIKNYTYKLML